MQQNHKEKIFLTKEMVNPAFYIKPDSFVDVYSLFNRLGVASYSDFFEMPKNTLFISGKINNSDQDKILKIYGELLAPKLVFSIGECDIEDLEFPFPVQKLSYHFNQDEYQKLLSAFTRGQNV